MSERTIVTIAEGPVTRLGQLVLAGEVIDAEPIMSSTLRVMDAYVLSVLIDGEGNYRDADGRDERLRPGAHTIVPPGFPHTYHTDPGERWTELFVVFTGPLFDALAQLAGAGPRYPVPPPSIEALRTVLRSPPRTRRVAEHQLLALADWLIDTDDTDDSPDVSMEIVDAMGAARRRSHREHGPGGRSGRVGAELRHVPAPVHGTGRPDPGRLPERAPAAGGRHAVAGDRPDAPGDRADPRIRRRVPSVPPLPVPLRRLPARLPPYLSYYARFGDGGE